MKVGNARAEAKGVNYNHVAAHASTRVGRAVLHRGSVRRTRSARSFASASRLAFKTHGDAARGSEGDRPWSTSSECERWPRRASLAALSRRSSVSRRRRCEGSCGQGREAPRRWTARRRVRTRRLNPCSERIIGVGGPEGPSMHCQACGFENASGVNFCSRMARRSPASSAGGLRQDFAGAKLLLFTVSAVFAEVAKSRKDLIGSRGSPFVTSWTS
jgi:hypothetical protein